MYRMGVVVVIGLMLLPMQAKVDAQVTEPNSIVAVDWSPDGAYIATADNNGVVQVLDSAGAVVTTLLQSGPNPEGEEVNSVAWSPDGTKLAATDHTKIQIWNTRTWSSHLTIDDSLAVIWSIAWSPDSTQLASVSYYGRSNNFRIWDVATGNEDLVFSNTGFMYIVAWSPDGNYLATSGGARVNMWSAFTPERQQYFDGQGGELVDIDWSPDGTRIVIVGQDDRTFIRDSSTGDPLFLLVGQSRNRTIKGVSWSPDGTRIATVSDDGTLWVWDAETGEGVQVVQESGALYAVDWSPDSSHIVYGGQNATLEIIDAPSRLEIGISFDISQIFDMISSR